MKKIFFPLTLVTVLILATGIFALSAKASVFTGVTTAEPTVTTVKIFSDVLSTSKFGSSIGFLSRNKIVSGYKDGSYKPDISLNRAEFMKLLVGAHGITPTVPKVSCFKDVAADAWFAPYVCYAKDQGLVKGTGNNTFLPSDNLSLAQALKLIAEAQNWDFTQIAETDPNDTTPYAWYQPFLVYGDTKNIVPRDLDPTLTADTKITRGILSEMLYRSIALKVLGKDKFDTSLNTQMETVAEKPVLEKMPEFDVIYNYPSEFEALEKAAISEVPAPGAALVASSAPVLVADSVLCNRTEVLRTALRVLKASCLETDLISQDIQNVNPDTLSGTEVDEGVFMGVKTSYTQYDLSPKIELRLGNFLQSDQTGTSVAPATREGKIIIEINTNYTGCDPERLKLVLYHELIHEQQMRRTGYGYWDSAGKTVPPQTTKTTYAQNHVDPRTMVNDCMELEAHLLTARCIQKEQATTDYADYGDTMTDMLRVSKEYANIFMSTGLGNAKDRNGCMPYLKRMKNGFDPAGKPISDQFHLNLNKTAWDNYLNNWWNRISKFQELMYEKFFFRPGTTSVQKPGDNRFGLMLQRDFGITNASTITGIVNAWKTRQKAGAVTVPVDTLKLQ